MGKIVAVGGGFDEMEENYSLILHRMELTGKKHPNFLFVPTSAFDVVNQGTLNAQYKAGCAEVDTLCLTDFRMTEDIMAEKIARADIICVPGGNLKFLTHVWRKTGAIKYLLKAYENGAVLTGSSAGAMCWFAEGYDNCDPYEDLTFADGMGIKDYCICPHFEGETWQTFNEAVKTRKRSGIAIDNNVALCLVDGKNYLFKCREDASAWYFDVNDGFKKYNLSENDEILQAI